jgi:non-ribosomal peptide synthetase component F/thioesterase domain-containing protein
MHLDPMALAGFIADQRVTHLHFVPSMLDVFLDVNAGFPTCCTQVFCSGEALRGVTAQRLLERSAVRLHNLYGPTEASVDVTAHEVTGATWAGAVPIGGPIDNITTHVLDAELYPVPVGVHGEIYLGGVGLAWGYLNRPELTAERFVPDPFGEPGARLYRTGDRCRRRPDGEIEFLGRLDHQVKIRGLRIEPGEVEAALAGHPAVAGAVVAVDQPPAGDPRLVAYVVPADGRDAPSQAELRAHLAQQLPAYMIPAHFVTLDALPTTASGKANRNALPAPDAAAAAASERAMVPPRTPLEEVVAAVWAQTLGLDRVGVEDGFFDLGGDSMRAVRVVGALRDRGIEVSVADLFQQRTVAALAAVASAPSRRADDRRVEPFALVAAADRDRLPDRLADAYPLSQVQAGMVFEMLSDDGYRPYHNVTCYAIRGQDDFSAESLRAAARAVVLRHEVLRTSFDLTSYREPMQLVHRSAEPEVAVDDLRSFPVDEQRAAIEDAMTRERAELFDLGRAPLWRLRAHQVSDRDWWLSMVECHAILDGWSHNALLTELLDRYRAVRGGAEAVDASRPLPVRFADFVAVERQTLRGEADRGFWAELLATHARVTIPDSWGDPTAGDEVCTLQLPVGHLDAGLRRLASAAGVPLKSVFLAGYLTALAGVSPESRFFIGLVCNGRLETRGGDEVYGMFLNTVPVPADVYAATWQRRVADVFAAEVALWPHRRYPIAAMQREMGAGRPLIETTFNYLDFYAVDQQAVDLTRTVDDSPNEFPLVVTILPGHVQLTVRSRRLSPGNAAHLGERYVAILAAMAGDADAALDSLPMPSVELPSAPEPTPVVEVERDVPHTAPGNPVEQAIADVWAELLGVDQVGIDDDFVQLGGHSLTAMRVSARLRTEHGIDASPRDVLRLRTVRRLAGGLPSPIPSSLVWLRRSGSRPPIVLVHPGGGGVHWYRELADALPADLPVAAIQHPAVTDPALAGIAVEELADRYLADLSAAVPGGPVRLLGWCGGAPVTWQVARRLHAAGEPTLLCLLDPALEGLAGPGNPPPQLSLLRRCEARFEELRGGVAAARADELRREIVGLLHVVVDDDRAHALISDDPDDGWHDAVRVWRRLAEARLAYRHQPYPGQMHLIVGDELVEGAHVALSNRAYEDYLARWRVIAPGGVRVHRVAGSHVGVLRPPRVTALAALLDQIAGEDPR